MTQQTPIKTMLLTVQTTDAFITRRKHTKNTLPADDDNETPRQNTSPPAGRRFEEYYQKQPRNYEN